MKLTIMYRDLSGMPRAWAWGDESDRDKILERARAEAEAYRREHGDNPLEPEPDEVKGFLPAYHANG